MARSRRLWNGIGKRDVTVSLRHANPAKSENKILTLHIFDEITLENLRDKFMLVYYDLNQLTTNHNSDNKVAVLETILQMPEK